MLQSYCQIHDESGCVCKLFAIEYVKNECLMKKVERNLGYHAQSEPLKHKKYLSTIFVTSLHVNVFNKTYISH